jgi:integrase
VLLRSRGATSITNVTVDRSQPVDSPGRLVVSSTKTADRRVVALDAVTLALIAELRAESASPWMFGDDETPPSPDKVGWWWKRVRADAGLDPKRRLHELRHWSATHAIAGGHDVRSVAARLGHADPTTTMRTYAHALEGRDTAIADTLDGDQPK